MRAQRRHAAGALLLALASCSGDQRPPSEVIRESLDATRYAVEEAIPEAERRAEVLAIFDDFEALLRQQQEDLTNGSRTLRSLNADPSTDRDAFEREVRSIARLRRDRRTEALELHFAMRELTDAAEWKHIMKSESAAFEAMLDKDD